MNPANQDHAGNRMSGRTTGPSQTNPSPPSPTGNSATNSPSSSATEQVRRDAAEAGSQVKQRGQQLASEAQHQMHEATQAAKRTVREATEQVKTSGREYAGKKKHLVTEELKVFRDAIQDAADTLRNEDHQGVATYVTALAEQLDSVREGLENRNVADLLREAQSFTRRRPEIVYGGMFVAGLAMMRFLKASGRESRERSDQFDRPSMDGRPTGAPMGRAASRPVTSVHGSQLAGDTRLGVSQDETIRVDSATNRDGSASHDGSFPRSSSATSPRTSAPRPTGAAGSGAGTGAATNAGVNRLGSPSNPATGSGVKPANGPVPGTRPGSNT